MRKVLATVLSVVSAVSLSATVGGAKASCPASNAFCADSAASAAAAPRPDTARQHRTALAAAASTSNVRL